MNIDHAARRRYAQAPAKGTVIRLLPFAERKAAAEDRAAYHAAPHRGKQLAAAAIAAADGSPLGRRMLCSATRLYG